MRYTQSMLFAAVLGCGAAAATQALADTGAAPDKDPQQTTRTEAPATGAAPPTPVLFTPPTLNLAKEPTLFVVGYSHLDTEWRWAYPQTIREFIPNTLRHNFPLFDKYPGYVFNFTGSRRYQFMEEYYPDDFKRLKEYVAAGRWFPCGSSVDENDANVPSAESFVRQVLYGNKYFRREFGVASDEFMLPDCFGFPAALPSMLAHCGLTGFSTQKLTWGSAVPLPFKVGVWEGPDGSSVIAALDPGAYVGEVHEDLRKSDSWLTRVKNNGERSGVFADYHYYGTGDQGGAPTEKSVANVEKSLMGEGALRIISGPADWLFKSITPGMREDLPRYKGELLLTEHSAGSISSQAYMKRWNRKNELLADAAERAAIGAQWLGARTYPGQRLENAWYLVLGSQMHDILPGTSLPKGYEYAWNDEVLAGNIFSQVLTDSVGAITSGMDTRAEGKSVVVYNPLSIDREDVVEATVWFGSPAPTECSVVGPDGQSRPAQILGERDGGTHIAFIARVAANGLASFDVRPGIVPKTADQTLTVSDRGLENARYRVTVDTRGDVASIFDKQHNREVLSAPARLGLHFEKPAQWPAWNMDWKDRQKPAREFVGESGSVKIEVVEQGPVRAAIRITRQAFGSTFVQTVRLTSSGNTSDTAEDGPEDRLEFDSRIDWMTRERSLKAAFPLAVSNPNATYDIQTGAISRPTNHAKAYEHPFHQWFDLTDTSEAYGVTVMSDCKYAADKPDNQTLRLTLLYTPAVSGGEYKDQATQDLGRHHMLYALCGHAGPWQSQDCASAWHAARLNQPLRAFVTDAHDGPLGRSFSLLKLDSRRVMVSAVKQAEETREVVVRLRELAGTNASGIKLSMAAPIVSAREIDGQERTVAPARVENGALIADVRGFGLKAYALTLGNAPARLPAVDSIPLALPFDIDVMSFNSDRTDGGADLQGRTYPGEQIPPDLAINGVTFQLGSAKPGSKNAILARGQSLPIPNPISGSAKFDRLHLLVASTSTDPSMGLTQNNTSHAENSALSVPSWRGFIGQWDNRIWKGEVPEIAYTWKNEYLGLVPGYIKPSAVAWFTTHHHSPTDLGDEHYQFCYMFHVEHPIDPASDRITLPNQPDLMILAATVSRAGGPGAPSPSVHPACDLFDRLDRGDGAAPSVTPMGGVFQDAVEVHISPGLYGHPQDVVYTTDGSTPGPNSAKFPGTLLLTESVDLAASVIGNGSAITSARFSINDTTPPRAVSVRGGPGSRTIRVRFSEPVRPDGVVAPKALRLVPPIEVTNATLSDDRREACFALATPLVADQRYELSFSGIQDTSPAANRIGESPQTFVANAPVYSMPMLREEDRARALSVANALPVKGDQPWTLNMFVRAEKPPANRTIIAGFGHCDDRTDGTGRYLAKFAKGLHFWSRNCDVESGVALKLGVWQMLTATYDGRTLRLFQDAKQIGESEITLSDDESVVRIAPIDPWDKRRTFEGEIRGITIWDTALEVDSLGAILANEPSTK